MKFSNIPFFGYSLSWWLFSSLLVTVVLFFPRSTLELFIIPVGLAVPLSGGCCRRFSSLMAATFLLDPSPPPPRVVNPPPIASNFTPVKKDYLSLELELLNPRTALALRFFPRFTLPLFFHFGS